MWCVTCCKVSCIATTKQRMESTLKRSCVHLEPAAHETVQNIPTACANPNPLPTLLLCPLQAPGPTRPESLHHPRPAAPSTKPSTNACHARSWWHKNSPRLLPSDRAHQRGSSLCLCYATAPSPAPPPPSPPSRQRPNAHPQRAALPVTISGGHTQHLPHKQDRQP